MKQTHDWSNKRKRPSITILEDNKMDAELRLYLEEELRLNSLYLETCIKKINKLERMLEVN